MTKCNLALAMIVKGSPEESQSLFQCLNNVAEYVDGIFITITRNEGCDPTDIENIAKSFGATISYFDWINDFSAARNFNFSQVPKEYTHILWADADDTFRGLEKLKPTLEENEMVDVFSMFYLYDFDEYDQPTVVHQKSMVVKNNNCVQWAGLLHEDFKENRALRRTFLKGIERLHHKTEERIKIARERNVVVASHDVEVNPDDPRSYWNLGNSLYGDGKYEKSRDALETFLKLSSSDDEKYVARMRLAAIEQSLGNHAQAIEHMQNAIGLKPAFPDAYHQLGQIYYNIERYQQAAEMIVQGLSKILTEDKPYHKVIVYNPRDYDYNPLMLLSKTYFQMFRPDLAVICMKQALKIQPKNEGLKKIIQTVEKEARLFERVVKKLEVIKKMTDKDKLKKELDKIPNEMKAHPAVCAIRNNVFVKDESSGKDLVIYCGRTEDVWDAETVKTKMVGGSEEAVINLSTEFAKLGWNVTVYNNCGYKEKVIDGVSWKPFWTWNYRDKQDVVILWRTPRACDYPINAPFVGIDVHDVINPGEFTSERLARITKVFFKTNFHRSIYPNVPEDKVVIIPNSMDFKLFDQEVEKEQFLMVNTSSPDRSLDVLPRLFKKVKERVPEARCQWAYGWDLFDKIHAEDDNKMKWKQEVVKEMEEAGIESLGRIPQSECAKMYLRGNILAYPSEFAEIDCITVKKAQACGCIPVTTDFGALDESVQYGVKIHSNKTKDTWSKDYQFHFGLEDEDAQNQWVDAAVQKLQEPIGDRTEMKEWTRKFEIPTIAQLWNNTLTQN